MSEQELNPKALYCQDNEKTRRFLQGQIMANVERITTMKLQYTAFCNPKGRVVTSLWIYKDHEHWWLIFANERSRKLCLETWENFAKVSRIELLSSQYNFIPLINSQNSEHSKLTDLAANHASPHLFITRPSAHNDMGYLILPPETPLPQDLTTYHQPQSWIRSSLLDGRVELSITESLLFTPHMLQLDQIPNALCLQKGCFVGQEIIARTHHLGKTKRKLFCYQLQSSPKAPEQQSIADQEGQVAGKIIRSIYSQSHLDACFWILATNPPPALFYQGKALSLIRSCQEVL